MEGYAKLARLMAAQDEFAILRRFRVLNMQNLLYLQADIANDEAELFALANRDAGHSDGQFQTKDWWTLSQGSEEHGTEQWEKFLEIRDKLEKYSTASHLISRSCGLMFLLSR